MRMIPLAAFLAAALLATAAQAMSVREFLATASAIPRNPTALLRSDTRRLMNEIKDGMAVIRAEQAAARQAGRRPATCMASSVRLSSDDILTRLNSIPESRRNISVTQALREWVTERYPCPG